MSNLDEIKKFFENYPAVVHITDLESFNIVFLNRYGRNMFHIDSPTDYLGAKCYEVLHGFDHRCDFCNSGTLQEGSFTDWNYVNEQRGLYGTQRDTIVKSGGRYYRVGILTDEKKVLEQDIVLQEMKDNEEIINEALGIALNEEDPDKSLNSMLAYLGTQLFCDRVYIFEQSPKDGTFSNTYEWCSEGVEPEIDSLQNLPEDLGNIWYSEFDRHHNIIIRNLEDYKNVSEDIYEILKPQNIRTLAVAPLILNHRKIGFYGVDNPPVDTLNTIETMYEVLGHFISALLRHRNNVKRLEDLSYRDQLTDLNNRHALGHFLESIDTSQSVSYFFCDLNGLKEANDTLGHDAGDELIRTTADLLSKFFAPDPVFRMGGDEFLSIVSGLTREEALERKLELADAFVRKGISSAVGFAWNRRGNISFDEMFRQADADMYVDKHRYHLAHPNGRNKD